MEWRLAYSLEILRNQVNDAYPNRSKISDGTIGDASHQAVPSDHNPNTDGVVCALDITHDPAHMNAHDLADELVQKPHPDCKYVISNYRIAGPFTGWNWGYYDGIDPHDTHIHISVGVGPDGQSKQPYDDKTNWNIGEEMIQTYQDVDRLYLMTLHRLPESNAIRQNYLGMTYPKALDAIGKAGEWLAQNHITLVAYPQAVETIKKLQANQSVTQEEIDALAKQADELEQSIKAANK